MTKLADWEAEGARARPSTPRDHVQAPLTLRVATWVGTVLLVAAGIVLTSTTMISQHADESATHALLRALILVVIGAAIAVVGAVTLMLRFIANTLFPNS
ncbi:hypothetical protein [Curtobacterium sp. SL109]|jgi:type VI protein secretion system component VasF|uniref:hypothetical protein n=1 Tax=Curtobacterium sp. SL109 TaxID=2994662 RepID=UPI0022722F2A|nr:hypothetical protein [Curtobacterium sp. SL109]MCY1692813.1 hypothetical protein [Curtobacterium sp. SL109]